MEIEVVQFSSPSPDLTPDCLQLQLDGPQDLETFKGKAPIPSGLVVTLESLSILKRFRDLVLDRGLKNKHKGLAKYMLGLDPAKIPLVEGSYDSAGRLAQGMRRMIKRAVESGQPGVFAVGVDEDMFGDLWKASARHNLLAYHPAQRSTGDQGPGQESDIFTWLIRALGVQCKVPSDLRKIYIGSSQEADLVRRLIMRAAENSTTVLILGDTGTGKEIVARQIHSRGPRQGGPFIPVNCGGIPQNLLESELFGHVKGAFTDAANDKVGLWQAAGKGTLFLDEIGELSLVNQAKILRAIEDGKIRRVGDTQHIEVDARVIAATNRDLFNMMKTGRFREDLYYRLSGFFIRTPALRDHPEDIPILARHLWRKITGSSKKRLPRELLDELSVHSWPGNVREMRMVLNNLFNLFPNENLNKQHLRGVSFLAGRSCENPVEPVSEKDLVLHRAECLRHLKRTHEVIDAAAHLLKKVLSQKKSDGHAGARVQTTLNLRLHEFEKLCRNPLFFHGQRTFSELNTLKGRITWLLGLVSRDLKEARKYWRLEVADSFRTATKMIFTEIEKLLAES